jgi:hypothetical protein
MSAKYTGRDISGQKILRVGVEVVKDFEADDIPVRCSCGRVTLTSVAGADGWPTPAAPVTA